MRWPIRFQLLLPNLSVVVLAIAVATGITAYYGGSRARQAHEENLRRVVATLAEAYFPLSEPVLQQMRGLSGADFVFFDRQESLQASTLRLTDIEMVRLLEIPGENRSSRLATSPTVSLGGRAYLGQRVAVASHDPLSPAGSLVVLYPKDLWWEGVWQAACPAILVSAVAVAAVVLVTTLLANRFVRPIHDLRRQAAAIARGDFQPLMVTPRNDEIRDLAVSINQMAEQLDRFEDQVRRHEQLRILGQLGAGIAHQLRNAATGGRMAIELHQRDCNGRHGESLEVALRQLRLMESYLQRFLAVGRTEPIALQPLSLSSVVRSAVTLVQPTCTHAGVELVFHEPPLPFWIQGDPEALRQLILNLVLNAVEAVGEPHVEIQDGPASQEGESRFRGETVTQPTTVVAMARVVAAPTAPRHNAPRRIVVELERLGENRVAVHVRDSGPGPAAEVAGRLFEPFVTSKAQGTGLGLYVARQVAEIHHGSIEWQRTNNETCFSIILPLIPDPCSLTTSH